MAEQEENLQELESEDLFPEFELELEEEITTEEEEEITDENLEEEEEENSYVEDADEVAIGTFKTLLEKGYIQETEEKPFDGTWESMEEYFEQIPNQVTEALIDNMPDPAKKLMDFALNKEGVTMEDLGEFFNSVKEDTENSTQILTTEDARNYLKGKYQGQFEEDVLESMLDSMEDKGEEHLMKKAKTLQSKEENQSDKKLQDLKAQNELQKQQQQEFTNTLISELDKTGYKANRKSTIRQNLQPDIIARKNALISKNPKAIIALADFYSYLDEKTGEFNLEAYQKSGASKATRKVKDKMISDNFNSSRTKGKAKASKSTKTTLDDLEPIFE